MTTSSRRRLAVLSAVSLTFATSAILLGPAQAQAAVSPSVIPAGTTIDATFDPSRPYVVVGEDDTAPKVACPDRNFVALGGIWATSVLGCNVIGTSNSTKVFYGWATDGSGAALINAKGFNSSRKATWYAAGQGTGRTIAINWGNVAASKQIQGISLASVATKIKFS